MKNTMKRAWEIAKEAVKKFGGKVKEYFAESLKLAWSEIKNEGNENSMKEKFENLLNALEKNGYVSQWATVKKVANYSGLEGAYTFLIYYAKRIDAKLAKGHTLPNVIHSMVTCSRCQGEGSSIKWQYTGSTCYLCGGNKRNLGSQIAFRREMKELAQSLEIITIKEYEAKKATPQKERTFKVEYFTPIAPNASELHEFKISDLTDTSWKGIESFVESKLGLCLDINNSKKQKTVREYKDIKKENRWVRIVF